jgi:2-methylisocitrate lyase-like PEP mutase family enzyme
MSGDTTRRERFRLLHDGGTFLMPNAWDAGSARVLASLGAKAIATTSSGYAASLGRHDQTIRRAELIGHVRQLTTAVDIPVSVDAERGYPDDPGGIRKTVQLLAEAGAAGFSIEDYDPDVGHIEPLAVVARRVEIAADEAREHGFTLTARTENHLYGRDDLDDTIHRLRTYRAAGAAVLYAPGLRHPDPIGRVVDAVGGPLNVLALPDGPRLTELAELGVRRVSTGGALAFAAYGALAAAYHELDEHGTSTYTRTALTPERRTRAFS